MPENDREGRFPSPPLGAVAPSPLAPFILFSTFVCRAAPNNVAAYRRNVGATPGSDNGTPQRAAGYRGSLAGTPVSTTSQDLAQLMQNYRQRTPGSRG